MKIPKLNPFYVGVNTSPQRAVIFLLLGVSAKDQVFVVDEKYQKREEGFSDLQAGEALSDWLEVMYDSHRDLIPPSSKNTEGRIQPDWIFTHQDGFAEHYWTNYYKRVARTDVGWKRAVNQVKNWKQGDILKIVENDCPELVEELKTFSWAMGEENAPVLSCLLPPVNFIARKITRDRQLKVLRN